MKECISSRSWKAEATFKDQNMNIIFVKNLSEIAERVIAHVAAVIPWECNVYCEGVFKVHRFKSVFNSEVAAAAALKTISSTGFQEYLKQLYLRCCKSIAAEGK